MHLLIEGNPILGKMFHQEAGGRWLEKQAQKGVPVPRAIFENQHCSWDRVQVSNQKKNIYVFTEDSLGTNAATSVFSVLKKKKKRNEDYQRVKSGLSLPQEKKICLFVLRLKNFSFNVSTEKVTPPRAFVDVKLTSNRWLSICFFHSSPIFPPCIEKIFFPCTRLTYIIKTAFAKGYLVGDKQINNVGYPRFRAISISSRGQFALIGCKPFLFHAIWHSLIFKCYVVNQKQATPQFCNVDDKHEHQKQVRKSNIVVLPIFENVPKVSIGIK